MMPMTLEQQIFQCIKIKNGSIVIDWEAIHKIKNKCMLEEDGSRSFNPPFEAFLERLIQTGILTYDARKSWTLTDGIADLSPKKPGPYLQLYFVRKEDAEAYKDAFYRNSRLKAIIKPAKETI